MNSVELFTSAALVGAFIMILQTFNFKWTAADGYAEYASLPILRRSKQRHLVDLQPEHLTIDDQLYESYKEERLFDATSRIIDMDDGIIYRGRGEFTLLDPTTL